MDVEVCLPRRAQCERQPYGTSQPAYSVVDDKPRRYALVFVPDFRIKQDVVPGRYTETWFEAVKPGKYRIFCTEYCGTWHSDMAGYINVLPQAEFDEWYEKQKGVRVSREDVSGSVDIDDSGSDRFQGDLVSYGRRVAAAKGCFKCHSVDGEPHIGTSWLDAYGREVELEDGTKLIADEGYLTESMMNPMAKIVKGYRRVMPTYKGKLTAPEAAALVEFIKSLRSDRLNARPVKEAAYGPINSN